MYLHLWNTWIDNESSQIEEVDFESNDIYIFFPFFSFCECVCVCFCVWFCRYSFAFTICPRGLSVQFFIFLNLKNNFFLNTFYCNKFILFYFILSSSFFLFFLPFILSRVEDRLLELQPGIRAVPLRWESQVQDTGPQETSQLHIIPNGGNLPEISISTPRPSSTQRPASYSAGHPMPNS